MEVGQVNDNRILSTLKSSDATLGVLVLALIAQTPHAADVFRLIVHSNGIAAVVHSYCFAIALELAVLMFVVQKRHKESYCFAGVSVAMNLSYYHLHDVQLIASSALPALLVSVALPVAIARYSHAVADPHEAQPVQDAELPPVVAQFEQDMAKIDDATVQQMQSAEQDASSGELIVHDDTLHDTEERIESLRMEGFDNKWIATVGLQEIAGAQLADLLGVNASTISRWRKAAQSNGHAMEAAQ
jgi:hypothetical protein